MKVSKKMAAVEQRRGREGKEDPPLRRMRMVNLAKDILGDEVLLILCFRKKDRKPEEKRMLGSF